MTATARFGTKPPAKASPPKAAPKPPGRMQRAAQRKGNAAAKASAPYVVTYGSLLAAAGVADIAGHVPAMAPLPVAIAAAAVTHAGVKLWENHGWHRSGGKAAMRKRRKYQGTATRGELRRNLSPEAAVRRAGAPVLIGRAKGQDVAGSAEDSYLVIAPPRSMKTGLTSCWAADAPGALLAYSSRCDQYRHTAVPRSRLGDVLVLNADGDGGIPSSFAWSPVAGCRDPQTAIRRAGDLMAASPRDTSGKDSWHEDRGARLIRYMLHAAAVDGASMHEVAAWVHDPLSAEPMSILGSRSAWPGWDGKLATLLEGGRDGDALSALIGSASAALGWMDDPLMAAAACPRDGEGVDLREFIAGAAGSIYMIGADRPHGSLAPYFAAFGAEAFEAAKSVAEDQGGRLESPFTILADEAAVICPLPFHKMTAVAGGYRIIVVACVQADSQLVSRWGEHDARTMRTNFTVKVIGGGFNDPAELEALSLMCGDRDTWDHAKNADGSKTRTPRQERLFPPERIRLLRDWHALVLHRNTRPVETVITPVWDLPGYQKAGLPGQDFPGREYEQAAIEAPPRREAIPMPGGQPCAVTAAIPHPALSGPESVTAVPDYAPEEAVKSWHATSA